MKLKRGFTLIELLVVIAIVAILAAILFPVFASARESARQSACLSNMRQIALAATMYMQDNDGALFHHHEDWVLDDGSLTENLPTTVQGCEGGGFGNSQAEKPWAVFFQPYLKSREVGFCPSDPTPRSKRLATDMIRYNGDTQIIGQECAVAPAGEQCVAMQQNLTMWSYLLNSVFTHKSCRYAMEGVLYGFATEAVVNSLQDPNLIMFAERNSAGFSDPESAFYYVPQDDYDAWAGEAALVQWGEGGRPNEGWISYNRHKGGANYIYADGHVKWMRWGRARIDHYPDHRVRHPLPNPPQ